MEFLNDESCKAAVLESEMKNKGLKNECNVEPFKASPTTIKFGLHAMKQMFGEAEIFPKQILKHSFETKYVIYHLLK